MVSPSTWWRDGAEKGLIVLSVTHFLERISEVASTGWRGTALAALFHPRTWRTDRTSFQVVGSPVPASLPLACPHCASPHQVRAVPLSPFALRLAFPALLAGHNSCDYYGDSVPMRLAPGRGSHVPSRWDVRAQHRCLTHHLHETSLVPILPARIRRHGYFVPSTGRLWLQAFCQRMCTSILGD